MSAIDIIHELPRLTEAERRLVMAKLHELALEDESGPLKEQASGYGVVDLRSRGVGEGQAKDLRARLRSFAEDWERPEASIYDEDPAR